MGLISALCKRDHEQDKYHVGPEGSDATAVVGQSTAFTVRPAGLSNDAPTARHNAAGKPAPMSAVAGAAPRPRGRTW